MNTKLIATLLIVVGLLSTVVRQANAQEVQTCTQVSQYSGGVGIVCGVSHEPVETGLADINPVILASIFFTFAGYGMYSYKKLLRKSVSI